MPTASRTPLKTAILDECEVPRYGYELEQKYGDKVVTCIKNMVMRRELVNIGTRPGLYVIKKFARFYQQPKGGPQQENQ